MKPYRAILVTLVTSGGSQRREAYAPSHYTASYDTIPCNARFRHWRFTIGELPAVKNTARRAVVLRYDAEAYENLGLLAQALLTGAAGKLTGRRVP